MNNVKKIIVWDNDQEPFPEFYDAEKGTYYRNDMTDPSPSFVPSECKNAKGKKKLHMDDVYDFIFQRLGESPKIIGF